MTIKYNLILLSVLSCVVALASAMEEKSLVTLYLEQVKTIQQTTDKIEREFENILVQWNKEATQRVELQKVSISILEELFNQLNSLIKQLNITHNNLRPVQKKEVPDDEIPEEFEFIQKYLKTLFTGITNIIEDKEFDPEVTALIMKIKKGFSEEINKNRMLQPLARNKGFAVILDAYFSPLFWFDQSVRDILIAEALNLTQVLLDIGQRKIAAQNITKIEGLLDNWGPHFPVASRYYQQFEFLKQQVGPVTAPTPVDVTDLLNILNNLTVQLTVLNQNLQQI